MRRKVKPGRVKTAVGDSELDEMSELLAADAEYTAKLLAEVKDIEFDLSGFEGFTAEPTPTETPPACPFCMGTGRALPWSDLVEIMDRQQKSIHWGNHGERQRRCRRDG